MASQTFITYSHFAAYFALTFKKVNALSEWIIGIYLHEFSNNEQDISILHKAVELRISRSLLVNECR